MTTPVVTYRVWKADNLVEEHEIGSNPQSIFLAPTLPETDAQHSILGITPDKTLLDQRESIRMLLDTLQETGVRANSSLTELMAQNASQTSKADSVEDYSSGEDTGDPNESTCSSQTKHRPNCLGSVSGKVRLFQSNKLHDSDIYALFPIGNAHLSRIFQSHLVSKPPKAKRRKL